MEDRSVIDRRALIASSLALAAGPSLIGCDRSAEAQTAITSAPLKSIAPFHVGVCIKSNQIDDPSWVDLATTQFSQLTPEWEMKMEYILAQPGRFRFDGPDRIADFAQTHNMALHGHTLIWYSQGETAFADLDDARFRAEYDRYISTVATRYRGRVRSWDVVNEPITDDGAALRDCLWSQKLGADGYIIRAFEQAKLADPDAVLFLNDYNLESLPAKGATFLKLVERLLKAGAPIGGIGSQSHLDIEMPEGQISAFIKAAAQFGLPIHISELDASLRSGGRADFRTRAQRLAQQSARVAELTEAFMALPAAQRFGLTLWGLRDTDTWLRSGERDDGKDSPVLFNASGQPNPMFNAVAGALTT